MSLESRIADLIGDGGGTKPYSAKGTVVRVDGNTAWVRLEGASEGSETPAQIGTSVSIGDTVPVNVSTTGTSVIGNYSAPATDDRTAIAAQSTADAATDTAREAAIDAAVARSSAESATADAAIAKAKAADAAEAAGQAATAAETAQSSADTALSQAQTATDAANTAQSQADSAVSSANAAGIAASKAQAAAEAAQATADGVETDMTEHRQWFYHDADGAHVIETDGVYRLDIKSNGMDVTEAASETSVAYFGADGTRIGKANEIHTEIDDGSMAIVHGDEQMAYFGYGTVVDEDGGSKSSFWVTLGSRYPQSAIGISSIAEGERVRASGAFSHAEGYGSTASGGFSHAEGTSTTASNDSSHAEGGGTTASGARSHAEGTFTTASGNYSHAEGYNTVASSKYQHAQGKFNIEDAGGVYAHIVGNGTSNANRSNAHTIDWDGNAWFAGALDVEDTIATRANLEAAAEDHDHSASEITSGVLPIEFGGTGADDAEIALDNLGGAPFNHSHSPASIGAAAEEHTHDKSEITAVVSWNETKTVNTHVYTAGGFLFVFYQGETKAHSANTTLFTLPSGYRPSATVYVPFTKNANAYGSVAISSSGTCIVNAISSTSANGRIYFTAVIPL